MGILTLLLGGTRQKWRRERRGGGEIHLGLGCTRCHVLAVVLLCCCGCDSCGLSAVLSGSASDKSVFTCKEAPFNKLPLVSTTTTSGFLWTWAPWTSSWENRTFFSVPLGEAVSAFPRLSVSSSSSSDDASVCFVSRVTNPVSVPLLSSAAAVAAPAAVPSEFWGASDSVEGLSGSQRASSSSRNSSRLVSKDWRSDRGDNTSQLHVPRPLKDQMSFTYSNFLTY